MGTKRIGNVAIAKTEKIKKRSPIMGTKSPIRIPKPIYYNKLKKDPQSWGRKESIKFVKCSLANSIKKRSPIMGTKSMKKATM